MDIKKITTRCCIAGGGPAGMMLGYLLARSGIDTIVIEKWPDFFRDFRGDTIHPSTMEVLHELDLLEDFLKLPHNKTYQLEVQIGEQKVVISDFSKLNLRCPYIAFIPQWDFLNFIASKAKNYPNFHLMIDTEVTDLLIKNEKIIGVIAKHNETQYEIQTELVVGADGRHSIVRDKSQLPLEKLSAPMDVLWFKLSRSPSDSKQSLGKLDLGYMAVMLERGDYWQCGFLIRKGKFDEIKEAGIASFQQTLLKILPNMSDRINEIQSFDQIKLLTVIVDRLLIWYRPGLICIGDAAHAMSPIGGVGINLAIQDAVASANVLIPAFLAGTVNETHLNAIQKRRLWPTRFIQGIQVFLQNRVVNRVLGNPIHPKLPFAIKMVQRFPILRAIPAYLVGVGIRPEHIRFKT